jgi:RNase P protein component
VKIIDPKGESKSDPSLTIIIIKLKFGLAKNRNRWRAVVNSVLNLRVP